MISAILSSYIRMNSADMFQAANAGWQDSDKHVHQSFYLSSVMQACPPLWALQQQTTKGHICILGKIYQQQNTESINADVTDVLPREILDCSWREEI